MKKLFYLLLISGFLISAACSQAAASVTIASGETVTFTANESWTIDGSLAITSSGTLDASAGGVNVSLDGDWDNEGIFTAGVSTVTFTGAGVSAIDGSTGFYNLFCLTAGKQLTFESGKNQTIGNILKLRGSSGSKIIIRASTAGTAFTLDSTKVQITDYLDVKDASFSHARLLRQDRAAAPDDR